MTSRDTSRDGVNLFKMLLTKCEWFWRFVQRIDSLSRLVNRALIDNAILTIPVRPNPLCCGWKYTTWEGLTNRRWSSRHLPPKRLPDDLPAPDAIAEVLFARKSGFIESEKSTLLFPYFAQWFTDGFLAADQVDRRRNHSNHELDLSQLYGFSPETTKLIREHEGGRLKSQQINGAEFPPFLFDGNGSIKEEFQKRRTTFDDFCDLAIQPLKVEQQQGVGPHLRANRLIFPDYSQYSERPDPLHPDYSPNLPSCLIYNELRLPDSDFTKWRGDWFAMANDRANSTPAFVMMNTLMLREHNRIAALLAEEYNNNSGWDDERIFQTTRNILTVIVLKIVVEEYINHITPYHFKLFVDPTAFFKARKWKWTNWMTVEFNLLYRWHCMIPDELQIGDRRVPSKDSLWNPRLVVDQGLAHMFNCASRQPAGRIGAKNTWSLLVERAEIPTIQMGRDVEVAAYNDYRELCGMPRVDSFDQISGDGSVQDALRNLYGSPDRIEFYAGLFAEDLRTNSALAPLMGTLVGVDAFSQALTNPLLQPRIFNPETFSPAGWKIIRQRQTIEHLVRRNTPEHDGNYEITMTRSDWKPT
jgi:prostaglandin-endoperoxide synthase 2